MIFQAVINGAAISGCEPYVFSTAQWKQLESERMSLLRRAFAGEAYNYTDKLRTLSDTTLRRKLSFPTLESITRKRRLRWYQSMLTRPGHHSIYLATLFGSFDLEKIADFGLEGSLTHRALPALRQLADDLTRFLPSFLAWFCVVMGSNISQSRFLWRFRAQRLEGGDSSVCGDPSFRRSLFRGRAGVQSAPVP